MGGTGHEMPSSIWVLRLCVNSPGLRLCVCVLVEEHFLAVWPWAHCFPSLVL